jgi:hypothetical protein
MSEGERQALAVAQNLRNLAMRYAENQQYSTALSLYDDSLNWATRANVLPEADDFIQVLRRERAALRGQDNGASRRHRRRLEDAKSIRRLNPLKVEIGHPAERIIVSDGNAN